MRVGKPTHGRLNDRMFDIEDLGDTVLYGRLPLSDTVACCKVTEFTRNADFWELGFRFCKVSFYHTFNSSYFLEKF